jgi:pyrroloquinoline quinone (PQQ) biosynthesis protein C
MLMVLRPRICGPASLHTENKGVRIEAGGYVCRVSGLSPEEIANVVAYCDGHRTAEQVAQAAGVSLEKVDAFLNALQQAGVIKFTGSLRKSITSSEFLRILKVRYSVWNEEIFSRPLWIYLMSGKAPVSLVDGWLIESYYFISGAAARLGYAVAVSQDDRVTRYLLDHHLEEYDHFSFFREALDLRKVRIPAYDPLPSTEAVINSARSAARKGPLHYTVCSGLLESTGSNTGRALNFYESVGRNFDTENSGFVEPLLKHVRLDQEYAHGSICEHVLAEFEILDVDLANSILDTAEKFKDTLSFWFDDIYSFYVRARRGDLRTVSCRENYRAVGHGFND